MTNKKILIVEARFYQALTDALVEGAVAEIDAAGHDYERIAVPGVLEIPPAIGFAADTGVYDAFVALGVVIRGETTHYELISESVCQGLMQISIDAKKPLAMGLIATENFDQAKQRCDPSALNKGKEIAQSLAEML